MTGFALRQMHRALAAALATFIVIHLVVHTTALTGIQTHLNTLSIVQPIYRNLVVEPLLVFAVLAQVFVGSRLVVRRWHTTNKGFWGWTQIVSGLFLAYFLLAHTTAALLTRQTLGLETDFHWAAAPASTAPLSYAFIPYYFLGVTSVFAHLAAVLHFGWPRLPAWLPVVLLGSGAALAGIIVAAFAGAYYDIVLPPENLDYLNRVFGVG